MMGEENFQPALKWLLAILVGASISCFVGVIDDIFDIKPRQKMLGQVIASLPLLIVGISPSIRYLFEPLGINLAANVEYVLGIPVIIFFVLGASNSLNLLDGLDGLCAGVTAIITVAFLLIAIHLGTWKFSSTGDPVRITLCLALVGGVCGFLPFNRHPAKIFMGDAGSILLGFVIATLMILFAERYPRWWFASIVAFGLPILDTATALVRRLINKKPLFVSDRGHIYDQMIDKGIPLKKTVIICYLLAAAYALIGLATGLIIHTKAAIFIYLAVFLISAGLIWKLGYLHPEKIVKHKKKGNS